MGADRHADRQGRQEVYQARHAAGVEGLGRMAGSVGKERKGKRILIEISSLSLSLQLKSKPVPGSPFPFRLGCSEFPHQN